MPNNKPKTTAMKILCIKSLCSHNSQRAIILLTYIYTYVCVIAWLVCILLPARVLPKLPRHGLRKGSEQQPLNLESSKSLAPEPPKPPSKKYTEQRANGRNNTIVTGSHVVRKLIMHESLVLPFKHVATVSTNNFHQS